MFKKVRYYFVLCPIAILSAFALTACGDDDDDEPGTNGKNGIVGEWLLVSDKGWEKEDGEIVDQWDDDMTDDGIVYEFKSDGKLYMWDGRYLAGRADYTYSGTKLTITYTESGFTQKNSATCKISGNRMTLTFYEKEREDGILYESYDEAVFTRIVD